VRIHGWELGAVPGLLQTESYAEAVIRARHPSENASVVDRIVTARMERQDLLNADKPMLWHTVHEGVLRHQVGGRAVMSEQLNKLIGLRRTVPLTWDDRLKHVTVVRINAITVPADSGDELARRFAARAGAVDNQDGFEGFELLKPTDDRTTWLVVTRWRDEAAFQAWLNSPAFGHGHRSAAERAGGQAPPPVGVSSELWSYEIAGGSSG